MAYLAGNPIIEKLANAKRVTFEAVLTCAANTIPTVAITSPASSGAVTLQFATGATTATGTLTANAYTGLSDMSGAAVNPVFAIEVLDGLAKEFIGVHGVVTSTSGTGNASVGQSVTAIASNGTITSGNVAIKATLGDIAIDATTGDTFSSLNAATGTVKLLITVCYV